MTRPLACPPGRFGLRAALGVAMLCGLAAGCPGTLDPSLTGGPGTGGTGNVSGMGGSTACDAPTMVFSGCAISGCHTAGTTLTGAGLDLITTGVVGRLLNKGPSTNTNAGASCMAAGKPYLVPNSNPATGLLLDKMVQATVTCGTVMPQIGSVTSTQIACLNDWATAVTTGAITQ